MFLFHLINSAVFGLLTSCLFVLLIEQTKKPRKGAILAKKINESGDR